MTGGNRGTATEKLRFSLMNHVSYKVLKATEHQLLIGKQLWVSGYLYVFLVVVLFNNTLYLIMIIIMTV